MEARRAHPGEPPFFTSNLGARSVFVRSPRHKLPTEWVMKRRLGLRDELLLAVLPTVTVLLVLGLVKALSRQHLLCATLASSAMLIYLDPRHKTNTVRTLVLAQMTAALVGWVLCWLFGPGYLAAGTSMTVTILLMILKHRLRAAGPALGVIR